jgi:hypothetical protein
MFNTLNILKYFYEVIKINAVSSGKIRAIIPFNVSSGSEEEEMLIGLLLNKDSN